MLIVGMQHSQASAESAVIRLSQLIASPSIAGTSITMCTTMRQLPLHPALFKLLHIVWLQL